MNITAEVSWIDKINSTPIDDLRNAQKLCADSTGYYGNEFEMTSRTFDQIGICKQTTNYLNSPFKMSQKEFLSLLWGFEEGLEGLVSKKNICKIDDLLEDGKVIVKVSNNKFQINYTGYSTQ